MIKDNIEKLKSWCKETKTPIFEGDIPTETHKISWKEKTDANSFDDFLNFVDEIKPKFLVLDYEIFYYEYRIEDIKKTLNSIEEVDKNKFSEFNKTLKSQNGNYLYCFISFVDNGFSFQFSDFAEWTEIWSEFNEMIEDSNHSEYFENKYLISESVLNIALELSKNELFQKAKNKAQREIAATLFMKGKKFNKKIYVNLGSLIDYADSLIKLDIESLS